MAGLFGLRVRLEDRISFASDFYWGTFYQQHLGEKHSGIAVFNPITQEIECSSKRGLFRNAFSVNELNGTMGIGYCGSEEEPFMTDSKMGEFAVCFSGNILNLEELVERFKSFGHTLQSANEAEILAKLIAQGNGFLDGLKGLSREIRGSYSLLLIEEKGIYVIRSPDGHWPLVLGRKDGAIAVATDSSGFGNIGFHIVRNIEAGEIVVIKEGRIERGLLRDDASPRLCSFYFIYTAFPAGEIEGIPIVSAREKMGRILAKRDIEKGFFPDFVTPVPDSGRSHGLGYHQEFIRQLKEGNVSSKDLPYYDELLLKYSYTGRSFTPQTEKERMVEADHKLLPHSERYKYRNKKIVVCDDSIVRGNQIRSNLVPKLRKLGVAEIHFRISSPKIYSYCPWGKSVRKGEAFAVAVPETEDQIAFFGIDGLEYNTIDDLYKAIGKNKSLCFDCMTY